MSTQDIFKGEDVPFPKTRPSMTERRLSRLTRSYSDDLHNVSANASIDGVGELYNFSARNTAFPSTHLRRASSTSALPRMDPAIIRSQLRFKSEIVEAALIDDEITFTYNNEEKRLPISRIIAVSSLSKGIKKKKASVDDSEAEDLQGAETDSDAAGILPSESNKSKSGFTRLTHKVWKKKPSADKPAISNSKSFPKLEKKNVPARILTSTSHKAMPNADSPAMSLYKSKKQLLQDYDMALSMEFNDPASLSSPSVAPSLFQSEDTSLVSDATSTGADPGVLTDTDSTGLTGQETLAFVIHVAKVCESDFNAMKRKEFVFLCQSEDECVRWITAIRSAIMLQPKRPRKLMVFVNPHGGKKKAAQICASKVYPLLKLAGIQTQIIETQHAGHCTEVCQTADFTTFDGVVVVGGDGLFNEALNGLLHTKWTHLRVGLIPAGSTNTIVYSTTGCEDATTSVLHIILGSRMALDVAAVYIGGKIDRFAVSMLSYGFYGEVMKDSENFRWMGPVRYDYSGFKKYVGKTHYRAVVQYREHLDPPAHPPSFSSTSSADFLSLAQNANQTVCETGCLDCPSDPVRTTPFDFEKAEKEIQDTDAVANDDTWQTIDTKFVCVNATVMSCRCAKAPTGMSPFAHLSDGCLDLICVKGCSRPEYLQHLMRLTDPTKDHLDFPFVEVHKVTEFRLRCKDEAAPSCWNIDGELLMTPDIHVKVYSNLVHLFADRPPVNPSKPKIKAKKPRPVEPESLAESVASMGMKLREMDELVQVLNQRCEDLEKENDDLSSKVETLETRLATVEALLQTPQGRPAN